MDLDSLTHLCSLLDLRMPRLNGKEVFTRIRELNPDLRVIFISGYTDDILQDDWIKKQGLKVLAKPGMLRELLSVIRKTLTPLS